MKENFVIAISSISGGGKTTLVKNVSAELNVASLFFDHYSSGFILDEKWVEDGAFYGAVEMAMVEGFLLFTGSGSNRSFHGAADCKQCVFNPIKRIESGTG